MYQQNLLDLKENFYKACSNKIDSNEVLSKLKEYSVIEERYEIINYLLNLAIDDKTFSENENNFIDNVAKSLELDNEKYRDKKLHNTNINGEVSLNKFFNPHYDLKLLSKDASFRLLFLDIA